VQSQNGDFWALVGVFAIRFHHVETIKNAIKSFQRENVFQQLCSDLAFHHFPFYCGRRSPRNDQRKTQMQDSRTDLASFEEVKAKAEAGNADSEYQLGVRYFKGIGVPQNGVEALKWWRKAAEQNYAEAQVDLGICYAEGKGAPKDELEAVKWFRKAAEQKNARAQGLLGCCYYDGQGVTKDEVEAVKWFRKAAEQNSALAQGMLAACYYNGTGVTKDQVEAAKWSRSAPGNGGSCTTRVRVGPHKLEAFLRMKSHATCTC
jgi:hypothetical protein